MISYNVSSLKKMERKYTLYVDENLKKTLLRIKSYLLMESCVRFLNESNNKTNVRGFFPNPKHGHILRPTSQHFPIMPTFIRIYLYTISPTSLYTVNQLVNIVEAA
jgi:hypothetical protein